MKPLPPCFNMEKFNESSPDSTINFFGQFLIISFTFLIEPEASLIPIIFLFFFTNSIMVLISRSTTDLPGMLYKMIGSLVFKAIWLK